MNAFILTILSVAAVATATGYDYKLKCSRKEMGIRWPSYHSNSDYYVCNKVGAEQIKFTCAPGELFAFVLQSCVAPARYIPAPPLSVLPTAVPHIGTKPWIAGEQYPHPPTHQHQHNHHHQPIQPAVVQPEEPSFPMPYYPAHVAHDVNAPVKPAHADKPAFLNLLGGVRPPVLNTVFEEAEKPHQHHHESPLSPPLLEPLIGQNDDALIRPPNLTDDVEQKPVLTAPVKPAIKPPMPPTPEPTPPVVITTPATKKPSKPSKPSKNTKPTPKKPSPAKPTAEAAADPEPKRKSPKKASKPEA